MQSLQGVSGKSLELREVRKRVLRVLGAGALAIAFAVAVTMPAEARTITGTNGFSTNRTECRWDLVAGTKNLIINYIKPANTAVASRAKVIADYSYDGSTWHPWALNLPPHQAQWLQSGSIYIWGIPGWTQPVGGKNYMVRTAVLVEYSVNGAWRPATPNWVYEDRYETTIYNGGLVPTRSIGASDACFF